MHTVRKNEFFWLGKEKRWINYDSTDPNYQKLLGTWKDLFQKGLPSGQKNVPVYEVCSYQTPKTHLQHLARSGVPLNMLGVADALWGKVWGANIQICGAEEAKEEENLNGETDGWQFNYRVLSSFSTLVEHVSKPLTVLTNWQAKKVEYTQSGVVITNQKGLTVSAKKALVAVPLTVMRDGDITFSPALPKSRLDAYQSIEMHNAIKVTLVSPSPTHG